MQFCEAMPSTIIHLDPTFSMDFNKKKLYCEILLQFKITAFYFNIFKNVIYSSDDYHGAHTAGRNEDPGDEDKLQYTVFNKIQQGSAGQDRTGLRHTGTRNLTSRPDDN